VAFSGIVAAPFPSHNKTIQMYSVKEIEKYFAHQKKGKKLLELNHFFCIFLMETVVT
jgi:hypothetical protein